MRPLPLRLHRLFAPLLVVLLVGSVPPAQAQKYAFQQAVPSQPDSRLDEPTDVAVSYADSTVYVADEGAEAIFRYGLDGSKRSPITSVQVNGQSRSLDEPFGLDVGPDGTLFVAERDAQRIFTLRPDGRASGMGRGGGNLGELDEPRDVAVDADGYTYALDEGPPYVPFFDPKGRYLSWIRGGVRNFEDVMAVETNGANEIYVLEEEGPSVTILDARGTVQTYHGRLNGTSGVAIEEPVDLAVLPGGDFLILDRGDGRITHFSRDGSVIGTFGAKGRGGSGTFRDPVRLAVAHPARTRVAVLDAEGRRAQLFKVPARPDTLTASPRKIELVGPAPSPKPFVDLVRHPDGRLYYIPRETPSVVLGVSSTGSDVKIQVDEARALALGPDRSLFVLDEGTGTIRQYDAGGALVREFGGGLSQDLDEPSDIAAVPSGLVLVSEQGGGRVRVWNTDGVYQRDLGVSAGLKEPAALAAQDTSHVYAWDADQNHIARFSLGPGGTPSTLRLRTEDVQANEGEVLGLEVDPLGQVHTFNADTRQYEIFDWADDPAPVFRFGREGEESFSFEDVAGIDFDDQRFVAHVLTDGGDAVTSVQLSARPPAPSDSLRFDRASDSLVATVPPIDNPAVVGYGLLRLRADGPPDTVATHTAPRLPVPPPATEDTLSVDAPPRYAVVSRSPTTASDPTRAFPDYFGLGSRLFAQGRYDRALQAYRRAVDSLALAPEAVRFIGRRYATLGRSLAENYDLRDALSFLRAARSFAPDDTTVARALGFGYGQQLRRLANQERYDSLRTVGDDILGAADTPDLARRTLVQTIDSIAAALRERPTEAARTDAVSLYKGLRTWTDASPRYSHELARAYWAAYEAKRQVGAPAFEQNLILKNARSAAQTAIERIATDAPYYHDVHLLLLDVLLAQDNDDQAVEIATRELENETAPMNGDTEAAYREALARGYRGLEKYDRAAQAYRTLVSAHPDRSAYKLALGDVLVENEAYGRAKTLYQELRTKHPDNATYVARIGALELERGNFSEASLQLEKALKMNPDLSGVRGLLGKAYDGASNYSKAIEAYSAAVQETRRRLDTTRTKGGSSGQTKATTDRLATYLQNLGRLHMQLGQYDEAITRYKAVTEVAPSTAAAWHGLGQAFLESGRVYGALSALNRALNLDQTNQEISKDLSRARTLRDKVSKNRPPVEIVDLEVDELYPSLYKNYSDPSRLPVGELVLANNTELPKSNVTVTVYVEDLMDAPTEQRTKPLSSYSNTTIPLRAVFSESILQVSEKQTVQGQLRLTYRHDGTEKTREKTVSITVHGRNAIKWKDKRRLAAFISPRDPQLIDYVKSVDRLFRNEPGYGLPDDVRTALRIYTVLRTQEYTYSVDPQTDFEVVSRNPEMLDYCQYPEETLQRKAGDCDDLVTLYLSLLANAGVSTAYVDIPGHVMSAFDTGLSPSDLADSGLSRKDVVVSGEEVWIPVETTLLGTESFLTAWRKGIERYRKEQEEGDLPQIISMADARTVYEPSSIEPTDASSLALPEDTSRILSAYQDQASTLYARQTDAQRKRLRKQIEAHPENTVIRNKLGILYARGGQNEKALRLYEKGLERSPTSALLLNNYANVLYQQERYEKAIDAYNRSLRHGTDDPEIYMNLCKAQLALGRKTAAASSFETAIEKNPSLEAPYSYLREQL